jgi:hypothetical protein
MYDLAMMDILSHGVLRSSSSLEEEKKEFANREGNECMQWMDGWKWFGGRLEMEGVVIRKP